MATYFYALHDSKPNGMFAIKLSDAMHYNKQGYGIYYSVQSLMSEARRIDNVDSVRCIAIDVDAKGQSKFDMIANIKRSPLVPSLVVESKNGYHIYWHLHPNDWVYNDDKGELNKRYKAFLSSRIIPAFDADQSASDISRVLRMPGFYHQKNPEHPFLVNVALNTSNLFTMKEIKEAYPVKEATALIKPKRKNIGNYKFSSYTSASDIKENLTIRELATKAGFSPYAKRHKCRSPKHPGEDKCPSLNIYDKSNSYYCFGCGQGGSVIDFYQHQIENVDFKTALKNIRRFMRK